MQCSFSQRTSSLQDAISFIIASIHSLNAAKFLSYFIVSLLYRLYIDLSTRIFIHFKNFYSVKTPLLFYTDLMRKPSGIFTGFHEFSYVFINSKNFFTNLLNFISLIIHTMMEHWSAVTYRQKGISQLLIMFNYLRQSVYSRSFWSRIMHQKTNVICTGRC